MNHQLPASANETSNTTNDGASSLPAAPKPMPQAQPRPLRLLHLMALVAALALTFVITPVLLQVIQQPVSGWNRRVIIGYQASLALVCWTPILAVIACVGNRLQLRDACRSYGIAAIFAAATALLVIFVRGLVSGLILRHVFGRPLVMWPDSPYSPGARDIVYSAPAGATSSVVAVWSMLVLTGAGRRPSDWFGHLGFLFGLLWVLWYVGKELMLLTSWS
jgi:hypothetical protein